jgi:hypothetical protein
MNFQSSLSNCVELRSGRWRYEGEKVVDRAPFLCSSVEFVVNLPIRTFLRCWIQIQYSPRGSLSYETHLFIIIDSPPDLWASVGFIRESRFSHGWPLSFELIHLVSYFYCDLMVFSSVSLEIFGCCLKKSYLWLNKLLENKWFRVRIWFIKCKWPLRSMTH